MIRGRGEIRDGRGTRPAMVIGLTADELAGLAAGRGFSFEAGNIGLPPMHVMIVSGESEQAIRETLASITLPDAPFRPYLDKPQLS